MTVLARLAGSASVVLGDTDAVVDPSPYLASRKVRRLMGLQDELAVVAAGRALGAAGLGAPAGSWLGSRVGIYLSVGYIPFLEDDLSPVLAGSLVDGAFDARRFGSDGSRRAHPFLTFRCLPNMPAFHVSATFGIDGPYVVAYPGAGQLGLVLEEALAALGSGAIDTALVLGVTHQRNFLVEHHFAKQEPPVAKEALWDAAACLVLRRDGPDERALPGLSALDLSYRPDGAPRRRQETMTCDGLVSSLRELGPASIPDAVHRAFGAGSCLVEHESHAPDGLSVNGSWECAPRAKAPS